MDYSSSPQVEAKRAKWRDYQREYVAKHGQPKALSSRRNMNPRQRWAEMKLRRHFVALGGACQRCGGHERLQVSHKVPLWMGGQTTLANVEWLCRSCHLSQDFRYSRGDPRLQTLAGANL